MQDLHRTELMLLYDVPFPPPFRQQHFLAPFEYYHYKCVMPIRFVTRSFLLIIPCRA